MPQVPARSRNPGSSPAGWIERRFAAAGSSGRCWPQRVGAVSGTNREMTVAAAAIAAAAIQTAV